RRQGASELFLKAAKQMLIYRFLFPLRSGAHPAVQKGSGQLVQKGGKIIPFGAQPCPVDFLFDLEESAADEGLQPGNNLIRGNAHSFLQFAHRRKRLPFLFLKHHEVQKKHHLSLIETQALVLGEQNRRQCDGSLLQQVHQSSVRRPFSFHVHPPHPYYTSAKEEKTVLKNKKHRSHADAFCFLRIEAVQHAGERNGLP